MTTEALRMHGVNELANAHWSEQIRTVISVQYFYTANSVTLCHNKTDSPLTKSILRLSLAVEDFAFGNNHISPITMML